MVMCPVMRYAVPRLVLMQIRGHQTNRVVVNIVGVVHNTPWLRCGFSTTTAGRPTIVRAIARSAVGTAFGTTPDSAQRCSGRSQIDVPSGRHRVARIVDVRIAKNKNRASDFAYRVKHDTPQNEKFSPIGGEGHEVARGVKNERVVLATPFVPVGDTSPRGQNMPATGNKKSFNGVFVLQNTSSKDFTKIFWGLIFTIRKSGCIAVSVVR